MLVRFDRGAFRIENKKAPLHSIFFKKKTLSSECRISREITPTGKRSFWWFVHMAANHAHRAYTAHPKRQ
jgi:hypothetical protein